MAGNSIRISTDQVLGIASELDSLNKRLTAELEKSRATVNHLSNIWDGEAARATISSYNDFASKFFQQYEDIINEYDNLIVVKSISKSYGVPGIRLGILCSADMALIAKMKKMVSIWNINSFAEYFMQILRKSVFYA